MEKFYVLEFAAKLLAALPVTPLVHWLNYGFLLVHFPARIYFSNFVKAYSRTAKKHKHFCAALEYVLPVYKNLSESGRGHSGTILESVIQWFPIQ